MNAIKYVLNLHILPLIGDCRIRDITPMLIQAIMADLSDKSNSLQSKVLVNMRSIFNALPQIAGNPEVPKAPEKHKKSLKALRL